MRGSAICARVTVRKDGDEGARVMGFSEGGDATRANRDLHRVGLRVVCAQPEDAWANNGLA